MQQMLASAALEPGAIDGKLHSLRQELYELEKSLSGSKPRDEIGNYDVHRVTDWLSHARSGVSSSSYGPTKAHRQSLEYAAQVFAPIRERLNDIIDSDIPALRQELLEVNAPWGAGQPVPAI
jgi:hypothetical protein